MNNLRFAFVGVSLLLATSSVALADVQWFPGNHDAWFTAVGGEDNVTTLNFTDFPNNTTVTDQYSELGVVFDGLNFTSGPFTSYHDLWGIRIFNGNHLYFDEPINWIAADIVGTLRIELYDGDELFHTTPFFGVPPNEGFGGLISDRSFDHIRVFDPLDFLLVVDDFHFGPPIVVPAPGALAFGPLILLFRQRRRA